VSRRRRVLASFSHVAVGGGVLVIGQVVEGGEGASAEAAVVAVGPVRAALRVHGWVVGPLSPDRYRDELLDELCDLADQRASWWRQVACVLRQLVSQPTLWAAARAERRSAGSAMGE
jgi:hypothetical protein